ncbi:hypothetical protein BaRGS_00019800 [Batillaria attramentaria]|uniref:RING-type domain-containing protein n=1 Tax=Batillaria attramentaria TaxID=370345 RepID=A0ABD0KP48_9CAEN
MAASSPDKSQCAPENSGDLEQESHDLQSEEEPCKASSSQQSVSLPPERDASPLEGVQPRHTQEQVRPQQLPSPRGDQYQVPDQDLLSGQCVSLGLVSPQHPTDQGSLNQNGASVATSLSSDSAPVPKVPSFLESCTVTEPEFLKPHHVQLNGQESVIQDQVAALQAPARDVDDDRSEGATVWATSSSRADGTFSSSDAAGMAISPDSPPGGGDQEELEVPKACSIGCSSDQPMFDAEAHAAQVDVMQLAESIEQIMLLRQRIGPTCKHVLGASLFSGPGSDSTSAGTMRNGNILATEIDVPEPGPAERALPVCVRDEDGVIDLQRAREVRRWQWLCLSCREREREVTLRPCGHNSLCKSCFLEPAFCLQDPLRCPVCGHTFDGVQFS